MNVQGFLPRQQLTRLLNLVTGQGYRWVGPQARDGAIVYDRINGVDALPRGLQDRQAPAQYRLEQTDQQRYFDWAVGPQALKPLSFAPRELLWSCTRDDDNRLMFRPTVPESEKVAVLGVRACDLAALALQDAHFLGNEKHDPYYAARREGLFLVAVHCASPAQTCFCASTGDGPRAEAGFDLALSEFDDGFLVESGSAAGAAVCADLGLEPANDAHVEIAERQAEAAVRAQTRKLPGRNLRESLMGALDHPRWDALAGRCLSCGNCTQVCPTCFCHGETETPSLSGADSEHSREWDSCFTQGHSYFAHLVVRSDTRLRYRQWLTHKLGTWHDQYERSGCVGCGRCITWCPVGIDITEEAEAICG